MSAGHEPHDGQAYDEHEDGETQAAFGSREVRPGEGEDGGEGQQTQREKYTAGGPGHQESGDEERDDDERREPLG